MLAGAYMRDITASSQAGENIRQIVEASSAHPPPIVDQLESTSLKPRCCKNPQDEVA